MDKIRLPSSTFFSTTFLKWGNDDRKGNINDLYENHNINTDEWEIYKLHHLDYDGTYGAFPSNKGNNHNWSYLGPYSADARTLTGSIHLKINNDGTRNLFILKTTDSTLPYNNLPTGTENNQWWTFLRSDPKPNFASVEVEFSMVICKPDERCSDTTVSMDVEAYEKLGSPDSVSFNYEKVNTLSFGEYTVSNFTQTIDDDLFSINETTLPINTYGSNYFVLEQVCLTNAKGENISCAKWSSGSKSTEEVLYFPTMENKQRTIPAKIDVHNDSLGGKNYLRVKLSMSSQGYHLISPDGANFKYHRSADSGPIVMPLSAYSNGKRSAHHTDALGSVSATHGYHFKLFEVCLKLPDGDVCHKADITDGSFEEGIQTQKLHFPLP